MCVYLFHDFIGFPSASLLGIQKLNRTFAADIEGPGGACHEYVIVSDSDLEQPLEQVDKFQKGPENDSAHGVIDSDLLEIVRDRLKTFQAGPYASRENACALTHIEEALMWMNRRVEDRIERDVLGTLNMSTSTVHLLPSHAALKLSFKNWRLLYVLPDTALVWASTVKDSFPHTHILTVAGALASGQAFLVQH